MIYPRIKEDSQWKNQAPGLFATKRNVADCCGDIMIVSRSMGFSWPSTIGGLSVGSLDEKFSERSTIQNLWPWR